MNTTECVTMVTGVATLITSIASLFTIWEMKKQRNSQIKPEIVSGDFNVFGRIDLSNIDNFYNVWVNDKEHFKIRHGNNLNVEIFNLGNGFAQNITFEWIFDFQRIIESIIKLDDSLIDKIVFSYNSTGDMGYVLSINNDKYQFSSQHLLNCELKCNAEFLPPITIGKVPYSLIMPQVIIELLTLIFKIYGQENINLEVFDFSVFSAKLKIIYFDLEKRKYEKLINFEYLFEYFMKLPYVEIKSSFKVKKS
ncbi:MAG: hypothetical protein V1773_00590 [bacterium]